MMLFCYEVMQFLYAGSAISCENWGVFGNKVLGNFRVFGYCEKNTFMGNLGTFKL